MTPEGKVKKAVKELLKEYGEEVYWFMPVPMGYGKAGVGDFILCVKGRFIKVETKSAIGEETFLQERDSEQVLKAGGIRLIIKPHDIDRLKQTIKHILES